MDIQLIRNRLVEELANLPDVATPEIQSYALTTAVLVRRMTKALNITDLRIQDAWQRETPHDLALVLNKIVHYEDFSRALVRQQEGEQFRDDYVYLRSRRTERAWVINLGAYFDYVRCFAYDDVFVVRYLLRRIDTLLSSVVHQPERDFDQHLLSEAVDRMYDSFALLGKLVRSRTLAVPPHRVINGYREAHVGSYVLPGSVVEHVPYGQMLAGYNVENEAMYDPRWYRFVGRAEKHRIDGTEAYMVGVLRFSTGAPNAEIVYFKMSDLLAMFKDLRATDWSTVSDNA